MKLANLILALFPPASVPHVVVIEDKPLKQLPETSLGEFDLFT